MDRHEQIASALTQVRARLDTACRDAGRDPAEVALLPVTKFFPASDVHILYELGCREFGESREPEASTKIAEFRDHRDAPEPVRWHMIGRLQRNKVKSVVRWADTVHSLDSDRLADALSAAAAAALEVGERARPVEVLIQVSLDGDPSRGGVPVPDLDALADRIAASPGLDLAGLMAVPPLGADPDAAFAQLNAVHSELLRLHPAARTVSAGMTGDLEAAVRHGSTCVRVGTALLGPRPIVSK
ncbi:YggS family pyridoxal phosphate-dependent enzyme [Rhodococcus sp. SGAir0479]|uniref:YggS family pyridoxal phosphate-dependent enzyme n=1 Tax=Rhodococcus sp. SGAir0479 TaxID=2567884 RepID=UPI0010CCEE43|nr:YggS family pyridoxal phosphate-dependent enzyme [Rhodococcus sp. SGAir0479]QCQ91493.1 YggS family pyridoxal phosphate-dependent enzyme [Rhodococcus sp. SGAir0479]